ncbi:MAG TPA: aldo/keto reductase [Nakamurella sp.]
MTGHTPTLTFNDGATMPQVGLGTARQDDEVMRRVVREAIEVGYRLIDTGARYGNEVGIGQGIADSGVPRDQLFVTTKLRGSEQGYDSAIIALDASLDRLGLDYVDLYLIHWPLPRLDNYVESWRALVDLRAAGKTRSIGVSNFLPEHLDRLAAASSTVPAVNQIELHVRLPQRDQLADDARRGILTQAWSPLANNPDLLADPVVVRIADRVGRSPAQVLLRWHVQQGIAIVPKASSVDRLRQNLALFDFELADDDLGDLATLETGIRVEGMHPATHEEF